MKFGKKLLAAIERGEWIRMRSWPKGFKIRKGDGGCFVDEEGLTAVLGAANVLATDWVIVRRKKAKAPKAPKADDPRYEPIEMMPVVGDKVAHPSDSGRYPPRTVEKILEAEATHRWRVEAGGCDIALLKDGHGWRILKRRNVFTDPKPGDVVGKAGATVEVRFVEADVVLLRWNNGHFSTTREDWAAYAVAGWTVQKLGA